MVAFGAVMLFFAHPEFDANINAMNSVSKEMINADKKLQRWGDLSGKCYVFSASAAIAQLQQKTIS